MKLGQIILQDGSSLILVQATDRNDAVESARTQKRRIELSDIIRRTNEKYVVALVFEQRDLLEKFIRDGLVDAARLVPAPR
jgi:hypothetical protein